MIPGALSGALLALCLPRAGFWPLGWIALAPLFFLWTTGRAGRAFWSGLAAGFGFHALVFYWILSTCRFAGLPWPLCALAWAALALFLALDWALAAAAGSWLVKQFSPAAGPWIWAAVWTASAFAWAHQTPRLCADILSYTQWNNLPLIQIDSALGPEGLGFAVAAVNAALAGWWMSRKQAAGKRTAALNLAAALGLAAAAWAYGLLELAARPAAFNGPRAAVAILQPNVDQYRKWNAAFVQGIWSDINGLLFLPNRPKPDIILWPESAVPREIPEGQGVPEAAKAGRELGAYQIVGAVTFRGGKTYNSAAFLGPDGRWLGVYHKRELVPFGEYVPLPFLRRWIGILDELGDLTPGSARQPLMNTPLGKTGVAICYEMMFPHLIRQDAWRGARVLVNITNDGWYKDTWGPYQHFEAARFRAVENRIYVARAANTGISGVVDPWGKVIAQSPLGARLRLDVEIPKTDPFPNRSFYARHGDWFGRLCLALSLLLAAIAAGRASRALP
ncbi:MAG: apolipoprotein N-acyltransferase [Elusimicrobiota bacterium]